MAISNDDAGDEALPLLPVSRSSSFEDFTKANDTMADDKKDTAFSDSHAGASDSSSTNSEVERTRRASLKEATENAGPIGPATTAFWSRKKDRLDLEAVATQKSVFDNPEMAPYFTPREDYENIHRFDPKERWTWGEELPLIRRLDWRVTLWACIAFFALDLPRGNISQANTDNFLDDLGLSDNDYNLGQTLFRLAFLLAELPSQLISKRLGPDVWIPAQMIMWSIVSASQFWLSGRASFLTCRVLIATLQGGFIPDIILYLSYFFKSAEMPFRLALFWMSMRMVDIVAPLMAAGILQLRGVEGREGWRWLFMLEGIITFLIGLWSCFQMVPSVCQTKSKYRPKGWFKSEREEKIVVNRILRDDPSKGDMHNRQAITPKLLWKSLCDYDLWPIYAIGLFFGTPQTTSEQYITLILRRLGFSTLASNLLTIPAVVGTTITMFIVVALSEKYGQRAYLGIVAQLWFLPNLVALAVLPADASRWSIYALVVLVLSYPYPHPIHVSWASRISNTVRTRTVSAAVYNMCVQCNGIIAANIYRDDDSPLYRRGNRQLIALVCTTIVLYVIAKVYYTWRNKQRSKAWNALSPEEKRRYLDTTTDEGSQRKDFQFVS